MNTSIAQQEVQVNGWVKAVVAANSLEGLRAIVEQTHTDNPTDLFHPAALVKAIHAGATVKDGQVVDVNRAEFMGN